MSDKPLVSIVTPAYRAERFVAQTIASVRAQTAHDWEMIIIDDCSPDDTCERVVQAAADDPRIKLLRQAKNGGPALARQRGLQEAKGRYIAFLDSDDYWMPNKLSHQLAFMVKRDAPLSFTQFRRINVDDTRLGRLISIPEKLDYHELLKNTAIATSTVIVDRWLTGNFRMTCTYYDDYALWLNLLKKGFVAYGLREDLVRYRVAGKSVSRNKWRSAYWVWRTYRDIERLGITSASWCFAHYALNSMLKYSRF